MKPRFQKINSNGFALVVTLSLMILLTIIAVGLLTLSSISLRSSGQGNAMATARSNAKLALMLAIGELQKTAGPDQRITAPANLVNTTAAPGITGVWKSWRPPSSSPDYAAAKTGDNFLGYLMSNPKPQDKPDPAALPAGSPDSQRLVGPGSVGTSNPKSEISAPTVAIAGANSNMASGGFSWVVLDEGVKGRIDLPPAKDAASTGEKITQVGAPARNGFEDVDGLKFLADDKKHLMEVLPKIVSLDQANLAAGDSKAIMPYFHDFTVDSYSVQSDVANGGLKTDLSVLFDSANLPGDYATRFLYSDKSTPLANPDPLWALYADYSKLYRKTTANDNPKDGLKAVVPRGYALSNIADKTLKATRYEPNMKSLKSTMLMPTVERIEMVFSLVARDAHQGRAKPDLPYQLHMMYLPVITLHNPYNVALRFTDLQVEFSDIPMGFQFMVNGQSATIGSGLTSLNDLYLGGGKKKTFGLTLSSSLTSAAEVVIGPGESRIFGKPFPPEWSFALEVEGGANGTKMFDWKNLFTNSAKIMPGIITGPKDAVGFDVDWLAPGEKAEWQKTRTSESVILLKRDDKISVRYGPKPPASAENKFSISVILVPSNAVPGTTPPVGTTQVFYRDEARLTEIVSEGTSPRFKEKRTFPAVFPKTGVDAPITAESIHEANVTPISGYSKARPFAIFSVGAKTTMEAFTQSRPVVDTGLAMQMATCDFTTSKSQGSSPLEFALVPIKAGGNAIESDKEKAFFFGGHGALNGTTSASLYEIPMAPLQSIAQLRHANGASIGSIPYVTYSVGESRAHPALPSDMVNYKPDSSRSVLDHSWLANDQLWDRYWFSTLATLEGKAYKGTVSMKELASDFYAGKSTLPNLRNSPYIPAGNTAAAVATDAVNANGKQSAAYMMTAGGFNVNSTSVAAWASVLSGLTDTDVPLASGNDENAVPAAPFLRVRQPVLGQKSGATAKERLWNSYRTLSASEVKQLAEKIVAEVRARGPFLSMAEFVNRRIGPTGELTNNGAIQSALNLSRLNVGMEANARPVTPGDVADFGWKNPEVVTGNTGAGAPGEITQGDILSAIGSFATVRSDTFRIRAYGDAKDGSGKVIARAWCEATVQRVPEYVDATDLPTVSATTTANINFGRQFKMLAFRWLHPFEI